jgi:hypothetical protein
MHTCLCSYNLLTLTLTIACIRDQGQLSDLDLLAAKVKVTDNEVKGQGQNFSTRIAFRPHNLTR